MKKTTDIILIFTLSFTNCEKLFLGEDEPNSPENNFELFWNDFDKHYGLFEARDLNWDSIYTVYRPKITSETTDGQLWKILKEMISYLDDSHTLIYNPKTDVEFESGSEMNEMVLSEFSLDLIKQNYLENIKDISSIGKEEENIYLYAKIKEKEIGYIHMNSVESNNKGFMDEVLDNIGHHKAIIIDIRNNNGGDDITAEAIAGRFADGTRFIYTVQERNGPIHSDFSDKKYYYTRKKGKQQFLKPIIILTDRITVSAAEVLLIHLKSFDHVIQIGDTTAGDFSDIGMTRFLPNGWLYQYSIMMYLLPDGTSLDGVGHVPDIQIRNTTSDIKSGNDLVFMEAIKFLRDEYGIE